jgi:hypothetical protein
VWTWIGEGHCGLQLRGKSVIQGKEGAFALAHMFAW